jgi:hypothetical protein
MTAKAVPIALFTTLFLVSLAAFVIDTIADAIEAKVKVVTPFTVYDPNPNRNFLNPEPTTQEPRTAIVAVSE